MKTLLFAGLLAIPSSAATLTLGTSDLEGVPGSTVSWSFSAKADQVNYVTYVASLLLFESNSSIGFYEDNIGMLGGPVNFLLPPGSPDWREIAGRYWIDPSAIAGAKNEATLRILFETYSDNPAKCRSCFVSSGWSDYAVSVSVAAIPEPGTALLLLGALAGMGAARRRSSCI